jgi:hypothetical protein
MVDYMVSQEENMLQARLDKDQYNEEDLISLKTPLNLPYYTSSFSFEKAYGSVELDGKVYQYVKRRVYNDTLELLCLPDYTKTKLRSAKTEYFKLSLENTTSHQNKKNTNVLKIILPEFCQTGSFYTFNLIPDLHTKYYISNSSKVKMVYLGKMKHPPENLG